MILDVNTGRFQLTPFFAVLYECTFRNENLIIATHKREIFVFISVQNKYVFGKKLHIR